MIRPLRRIHRGVFLLLGVGLPVLFLAALSVRPEPARVDRLPLDLVQEGVPFDGEWNHPDALLYWSLQPATLGGALPPTATLLGSVREGLLRSSQELPPDGHLVVYSLATETVVQVEERR